MGKRLYIAVLFVSTLCWMKIEWPGETAHLRRIACGFAARISIRTKILGNWKLLQVRLFA